MSLPDIDLEKFEQQMKIQAKLYLAKVEKGRMEPQNYRSILLRLTGYSFDKLDTIERINQARSLVEIELCRERKRARMRHFEYDLNRHIALHQARKTLNEFLQTKKPATSAGLLVWD